MEKKTAGLVGAIAGLATFGTAHAATQPVRMPAEVMQVSSYAELLTPIPNATELLRAANAEPRVIEAQYYNQGPPGYQHHHHAHHHHHHNRHHHHAWYPPPPPPFPHHHHHHHHHHHGTTVVVPGIGVIHSGG